MACAEFLPQNPTTRVDTTQQHTCEQASLAQLHALLFDTNDVLSVQRLVQRPTVFRRGPLKQAEAIKRQTPIGARLLVLPRAGLTAEFLQYTATCDHFKPATVSTTTATRCPLELAGVSIQVSATGSAFAIDVTSRDPATADEILVVARELGTAAKL